jgi:O-antigen/teichoic acid export membrane protein
MAFSDLIVSAASFKYEYAIVSEHRLKNAVNLLLLSLLSVLTVSVLCALVLWALDYSGFKSSAMGALHGLIYLVPVSVAAFGGFECLNYWFNRNKNFINIGIGKICFTAGGESVKVISGFSGLIHSGLILGRVAGQIVGLFSNGIIFYRKFRNVLRLGSLRQMKLLAIKHKNLPLFTTPSIMLGSLINYLYIQMFLTFYGQTAVGIMGVSVSYVAAAFGILSVSFSQVFYRKIAEVHDSRVLQKIFFRYAVLLLFFSGTITIGVYLLPSELITFLLGKEWAQMLPVMRIMVLWLSASFVISSLSFIFIRLNRQKEMFLLDVTHLIAVVAAVYFAHHARHDFYFTLRSFAGIQIAFYVSAFIAAVIYIRRSIR